MPANVGIIFPVQSTTCLFDAAPSAEQKTCSTIYIGPSVLDASRYNLRHVLQIGSFCVEVPPIEPKKAMVKPNFRTPPR